MKRLLIGQVAIALTLLTCGVVRAAGDDAAFGQVSVAKAVSAAGHHMVTLTMKNTGDTTWTKAAGHRLGAQNPGDNFTWGMNRVDLPNDVPPQGTVTFTFEITAPQEPGIYNFQWRMVHEGVAWFGATTPNVAVEVRR